MSVTDATCHLAVLASANEKNVAVSLLTFVRKSTTIINLCTAIAHSVYERHASPHMTRCRVIRLGPNLNWETKWFLLWATGVRTHISPHIRLSMSVTVSFWISSWRVGALINLTAFWLEIGLSYVWFSFYEKISEWTFGDNFPGINVLSESNILLSGHILQLDYVNDI